MTLAEPPSQANSVPDRVGRYEILLPIGTGGMATVYLARVPVVDDLYRDVALKLMHPHLRTEDGVWATQLVDEAKLAASIRHPNVVPVLEVGEDAHGVFLVMEYVEGDTLSGIIRAARAAKSRVPPSIVVRILSDALLGLHAAHELRSPAGEPLNLVHRDFSPQNLLVGTDGIARLTDFGIAKVATQVNVTVSGIVKGKVGYMAPEQAFGRPLDRRCDVWAAGVVAWELLALRRLYPDHEQAATLLRLVSQAPERIRQVRPDVPREVDDVIASALTIDVKDRCPSALELRRRLVEAWGELGPVAEPSEVGEYVRGLMGAKIEKRRQQVASVLALRDKITRVSVLAIEEAKGGFDSGSQRAAVALGTPDVSLEPAEPDPVESNTEQSSSWSQPRPPMWRRSWLGAGLVVAGVVTAAVFGWLRLSRPLDPVVAQQPSASASQESPAVPPSAAEAPASASAATVENRAVLLRASTPMSAVRIGRRDVVLAAPTREVEIQLTDAEQSTSVDLTVTAQDGRRVSTKIGVGQSEVELSFPSAARVPAAKASGKKPPGLAPTPYGP
jgi:serine/threonine-protein kinase